MASMPVHPAVVHIPIGLAVVTPVLAGLLLLGLWRGWANRRMWSIVVFVQAIVLVGALVALRTGRAEEERVEHVTSEAAVELHEEHAEAFTWLAGLSAVVGLAVLLVRGRGAMLATAVAATVASGAVVAGAWWVGHSGGALVYQQGAAAAYSRGSPGRLGGDVDD